MEKLLDGHGQLISIEDVELTTKPQDNMVLAREGVFHYISKDEVKEILIRGGETEDLDDVEDEYHMIIGLENYLFSWFKNNKYDEELMQIIYKDFVDETLLHIQVKMLNKIWNYDYKIMLDIEGNVTVKEEMILDKDCFNRVFRCGKYERKVEDLEIYENGFIRG